jgi:hypothetical protein
MLDGTKVAYEANIGGANRGWKWPVWHLGKQANE